MMKRSYNFLGVLIVMIALTLLSADVYAQPGDPSGDPDVPITGIELLLVAGGALGIKKLINTRKNKS